MNTVHQSCLPVDVLTAVYRRAVAQAYLDICASLGVTVGYSLDELQMTIAMTLEGYYVQRHGPENGMEMACTMLSDMVSPDILVAKPRLTLLGQTMMDELCCNKMAATHHTTLH
jgi:hypothetical protein